MASAASAASKVLENLSRPGTTKSWTSSTSKDVEQGQDPPQTEPAIMDEYLEEELAQAEMMDKDNVAVTEDGPVGCWEALVTRVSAIWRTTDMLSGEGQESIVKTSTREFVIYLLFMVILCFGKFSTQSILHFP